jgi:aldehyde dehydrogenase (NAD+)
VAAQVIPWNFPLLMAAWKLAPALAAGNTVVLKPAETTPLTALRLGEVIQEAGLPEGVVNILTGAGATGAALVGHDGVDKVAFTGSTEVGKAIQRTLAGSGRKLTLELGGKAANLVFEDAPLDQAVEGIVNGIYFNQGHVCCAGSRLLVQESIAEPLVDKLKRRMATLRVGDPLDKNTDVGAINSRAQLDKITELVASGEADGAQAWQAPCELPSRGFWFRPTVFTSVAQSYRIAQEEIFGPVLSVLTFRTPTRRWRRPTTPPTGCRPGSGPTRAAASWSWPTACGRGGVGQHLQPLRPRLALRRLQGVRLRPRGRPPRPGRLPGSLLLGGSGGVRGAPRGCPGRSGDGPVQGYRVDHALEGHRADGLEGDGPSAHSATTWSETSTWPGPAWAAIRAARLTVRPK